MNHDHLRMLLPRYAAGTLGGAEVAAVHDHLATGCTACFDALYRLPVGLPRDPVLPRTAPPPAAGPSPAVVLPPQAASPAAERAAMPPPSPTTGPATAVGSPWLSLATAGLIAAAALGAVYAWTHRGHGPASASDPIALHEFQRERAATIEMIDELASAPTGLQVLILEGAGDNRSAHGAVLWTAGRDGVLVVAAGLPPLPVEHSYVVRFTTAAGVTSSSPFTVPPRGDVSLPIRLGTPPGRLYGVEVVPSIHNEPTLVGRVKADAATTRSPSPRG